MCRVIQLSRSISNHPTIMTSQLLGWASLPLPLLFSILHKFLEPIDHIRFAMVCKDWLVLVKDCNRATRRWHNVLPMLMIPTESQGKRKLYSFPDGKTYGIQLPVPSNNVLDRGGLIIALVNPFRKAAAPIRLPRLDFNVLRKYCEVCLPKVILSEDTTLNPGSCVVYHHMIGFRAHFQHYRHVSELAFTRGGQKYWIYSKRLRVCLLTDAILHKGQVYAVGKWGNILSLDVNSKPIEAKMLNPFLVYAEKAYLVESTKGELLHVFVVYKLVFYERDGSVVQHVKLKTIGEEVLFLGNNYSISVLALNFPSCLPNSIYYKDGGTKSGQRRLSDSDIRPSNTGVFNLEDETNTQHYSPNVSPALWIVPLFNGLC
ncbi:hypothetical protein D8674_010701 [Pyrus ussuriensis x Pyrus communis]|uniref:Uncharacterized protein n=1 Tax=Pyrus ussuriensis x Pyrus communis TaxID=2448454 RepID=A0A5N5FGT4_9ROSA|nr:hypothetical protein D8674_010701 [Pyrus ussuriensis x Pyrus communis]